MSFGFRPSVLTADDFARILAQRASSLPENFSLTGPSAAEPALVQPPVRFGFGVPGLSVPRGVPQEVDAAEALPTAAPALARRPLSLSATAQATRPPNNPDAAADIPASDAVPSAGQMPPGQTSPVSAAAQPEERGFDLGAAWNQFGANGGYDLLTNLGIGLMSAPGVGPGAAAGMQLAQRAEKDRAATDLARAEYGLKARKLGQEAAGQNATVEFLVGKGHSRVDAQAMVAAGAAGNREALSAALANAMPKASSGYAVDPQTGRWSIVSGSENDPAVVRARAQAQAEGTAAGKPDEDYNMSSGQTRYSGSTNQPIVQAAPQKPESFDVETKLRGEFAKGLGTFGDVHDGYGRVIAATRQREANPSAVSPASDIGLIFGYMKMLDPGSVVREGEYATAKNAAGIPTQVVNAYNKALNGEFLSPQQRQDFIGQAGELYGTARKGAEGIAGRYRGLASQYGVDPDRTTYLPEAPAAPVVNGRRSSGNPLDVGGTRDLGAGVSIRRTR